jgi:hypothetical protein
MQGMNRREHLLALGTLVAGAALPVRAQDVPDAADTSRLIYLTPIRRNGGESRCQSEIWFVRRDASFYVVTAEDAWRARAVRQGLNQARIWVGDVGVWSDDARYKTLPMVTATASAVTDGVTREEILEVFGGKYADEWGTWGPRWRRGLADGSRVMLRYAIG